MKQLLIISITVLLGQLANAQPIATVKYDDKLIAADAAIEAGDYYNALDWYRQAYKEERASDVGMSIAYAYYKLRDFKNAESQYTRILKDDVDNIFIDDNYAYGRTLRSIGELQKAVDAFQKVIDISTDQELVDLAKREIQGLKEMSELPENDDVVVQFAKGSINSGSGEYAPNIFDESTIYFSSFKRNKEIIIDGTEKDYHAKIYRSTMSDDGYGKPEALDQKINRDGYHVSNVTFSSDKRRMYFTRQLIQNDVVTYSQIYYSDMGDDDWGAATVMPSVNGEWIAKQPAFGELLGRRVMYFVSDMEGGFGGDDLYYVNINGDNVGEPVNLGETINSAADEITPHYYNGDLYFSTDGRPGIGGFDAFTSTWDGKGWATPENMGLKYNTPFDDFYLYFDPSGSKGFVVSNRPDEEKKKLKASETCCFDIYDFSIRTLKIDLLVGVGTEDEKPLNGATVELADQTLFDEPQAKTQPEEYRFNFPLSGERKYRVIISKEGYTSDTLELTTLGITEDTKIRKKVLLRKMPPPKPDGPIFKIDTVTINEAIRFDNIYYAFDKSDILPASEKDLTIILGLLNEYDNMVIELSSHTDCRGYRDYNQKLSQRRAESARKWLLERGVDESRIVPKGYGEDKILNGCTNEREKDCSEDEHQFNRRTEFKILEGPKTITIKREVKSEYNGGKQSIYNFSPRFRLDTVPVMTFDEPRKDIGKLVQGKQKKIVYEFENTGTQPLEIQLATTCKCTNITWPETPVLPGERGKIVAIFDSTGMEGVYHKTIDIIANTNPIVVEAKFDVEVILEKN